MTILKKQRTDQAVPIYVGAMFCSSDAAFVSKIFLTGITGKPPDKGIDKFALGATGVVPWEYCPDSLWVIKVPKHARKA